MKNFHKENRSGGNRSFGNRDAGRPTMMHKATCSQCGKDCQLPFRPNGNRAVFCSTCFEEQKNGDADRSERSEKKSFDKHSFKDPSTRSARAAQYGASKKMFEALCSNCGNNCLVPFRPIGGKPVFCNKCFDKGDNVVNKNFVVKSGNSESTNIEQFKAQLEMLDIKLDRILRVLTHSADREEVKNGSAKIKAPKKAKTKKKP